MSSVVPTHTVKVELTMTTYMQISICSVLQMWISETHCHSYHLCCHSLRVTVIVCVVTHPE